MKDIKEIIRQGIERLYDGEAPKHDQQCNFNDGYFMGIDAVSKFIDSQPDDSPDAPKIAEDLEEAAHHIAIETLNDTKFMTTTMGYVLGKLQDIFIAGAEWQRNQLSEIIGQLKKEE